MGAFQWQFVEGFEQVAADSGPPAWVEPWAALLENAGPRTTDYLRQCEERGWAPAFGYVPYAHPGIGLLPVSRDLVTEEFMAQQVIVSHELGTFRLSVAEGPVAGPCPVDRPVAFVSLARRVTGVLEEGEPWPAPPGWPVVGAIDAAKRWTDRMVVADVPAALQRAQETGQPFIWVWSPGHGQGGLGLVDVDTGERIVQAAAALTRAVRPCPLIVGAPPGQLCKMYGGPWVSASILASARWSAERANRLADVGCDTCGDGRVRVVPFMTGGPQVVPGLGGPGPLSVPDGARIEPKPGRERWQGWPAPTRYAVTVVTEER